MELQITPKYIGLVGTLVDEMASIATLQLAQIFPGLSPKAPPSSYHITLITTTELQQLANDRISGLKIDTQRVYSLGIGEGGGNKEHDHLFVVVIWAAGQQLRKQLGLPPKHFYITLWKSKDHRTTHQGIDSLIPGQFPGVPHPDLLDHLTFTLLAFSHYTRALPFCVQLVQSDPMSYRGFLRYADITLRLRQHKTSMLAYACAFQRTDEPRVKHYCSKKMAECSLFSEWGCVFTEDETRELPEDLRSYFVAPWSADLRSAINDLELSPKYSLSSREALLLHSTSQPQFRRLPRFFRWLVPFQFAIMSTPRDQDDISLLSSPHLGIRHILSLTEEQPLPKAWFAGKGIKHTYLPIANYHPPTIEQMDLIVRLFEDEERLPLLVHCGGGKGRAGSVAACYLVAYGFRKPQGDSVRPVMSANEAFNALRTIRPGSIETPQQEAFVTTWCSTIWKRQHVVPPLVPEPLPSPMIVEGELDLQNDLFLLVGLPGSGKSWFSRGIMARNPKGWIHISQDDSGSRALSETAIGRASGRVILDRCNTSASDRKRWLQLASWAVSPVCVWFDYGTDLCVSRAQNRAGHPTLPPGGRVRNAVDQMRKDFVKPNLREGFKAIITVRSFAASQELMLRLSSHVGLFKYPRTPHLLDLGAATDDDIVENSSAVAATGHVVITEKVDGANMGISLSSDRQILVQNRAHYVNPLTHEQFKKLGLWVECRKRDLFKVLDRDEYYPERFILFGEWLAVTHSIPYTHLPARFLAFDLYDRRNDAFADRKSLARILESTAIHMVPVILEGRIPNDEELRGMVQKQSLFWDGKREGIYLKIERAGRVVFRGKVVRGDFIPGNEHWTRGNIRVNGIEEGS